MHEEAAGGLWLLQDVPSHLRDGPDSGVEKEVSHKLRVSPQLMWVRQEGCGEPEACCGAPSHVEPQNEGGGREWAMIELWARTEVSRERYRNERMVEGASKQRGLSAMVNLRVRGRGGLEWGQSKEDGQHEAMPVGLQ